MINAKMVEQLLILSEHAAQYHALLQAAQLPDLTIVPAADPAQALAQAPRCQLVFGEPALVCQVIDHLPGLRWVQSTWAGVDPLLNPALRRDYLLTNARGVFGPLIAEFVFGYILLLKRRILPRLEAQRRGQWDETLPEPLGGLHFGLLGVGSIGAHLARTARHFGMHVQGYTRSSRACPEVEAYYHGESLLEFASNLDFLVNTLPNTPATRRIVNARLLQALPSRAVFINVGRGSAVDEPALAQALQSGQIAAAVLDVFEQEPLPPEHIFWQTPNLYITAHTAAPSFPADIARLFVENFRRWRAGEALQFGVDFERGY